MFQIPEYGVDCPLLPRVTLQHPERLKFHHISKPNRYEKENIYAPDRNLSRAFRIGTKCPYPRTGLRLHWQQRQYEGHQTCIFGRTVFCRRLDEQRGYHHSREQGGAGPFASSTESARRHPIGDYRCSLSQCNAVGSSRNLHRVHERPRSKRRIPHAVRSASQRSSHALAGAE